MKRFRYCLSVLFVSIIMAAAVHAAEKLQEPKVEYSADMTIETEQAVIKSKVFHALGGRERQEMDMGGKVQPMIVRMDKQLTWMLMPESKSYMEMSLKEGRKDTRDINDCSVDQKPLGSESVNGVKARKNKISMTCPGDYHYEGHMWTTNDGIMVKMDAVADTDKKKMRIKIELNNLKIAKQSPSLFEVPAGYTKMNMGDMMKGMGNWDQKAPEREKPRKKGTVKEEQPRTGRDYTSQPRAGRDYTSQPRTDSGSTSGNGDVQQEGTEKAIKKVRGLFGF